MLGLERERERGLDLEGLLRFYAKRERVFFFFFAKWEREPVEIVDVIIYSSNLKGLNTYKTCLGA